mgnify:CR=1 FL=1
MKSPVDPTRPRLIAAALRLMQCHGYCGVGLAAILKVADVPKGSLYHHFPKGKEGLAVAAIAYLESEVDSRLQGFIGLGLNLGDILLVMASECGAWLAETNFTQTPLLSAIASGGAPSGVCTAAHNARTRWIKTLSSLTHDQAKSQFALTVLEGGLMAVRLSQDLSNLYGPVALAARALDQIRAEYSSGSVK